MVLSQIKHKTYINKPPNLLARGLKTLVMSSRALKLYKSGQLRTARDFSHDVDSSPLLWATTPFFMILL